ncbi:MAG: endopeptidase La, partial [Elusimicrobia bacterium]|nr:endopeptidase La [Elusimicrobiota bacterium]
ESALPEILPVVAIRDVVMFPNMTLPLSVDREKSIRAIEVALKTNKTVLALAQKNSWYDDPKPADIYHFGVASEVTQYLKMPDGTVRVFLQGVKRAAAKRLYFDAQAGSWFAEIQYIEEIIEKNVEIEALMRQTMEAFESYVKLSRRIIIEAAAFLRQIEDPSRLADTIASNLLIKASERQSILEIANARERLEKTLKVLTSENQILSLEEKIHSKVRTQIDKSQKEYYLSEQMKAIQKELHQKDDFQKEIEEIKKNIKKAGLSEDARIAADKEIVRLEKMAPFSPEATVSRTYLDWLVNLPWDIETKDVLDIKLARKILDEDHYGLEKPKERILEYLAVCKLTKTLNGPILCFVGPPGVGKTSIARSIARSMGRKFTRMSLGGVRDEAEIRGHRRTYIASMPGRIIQSISKAKSRNPVFLLDEIDKMGMDWRGDPAAALLEVLDPEQNKEFTDHYLDLSFDISKVMFITTANSLEGIPYSLRDRLEIIEFTGYTHDEKRSIAQEYLLPRQMKEHGMSQEKLEVSAPALDRMIIEYTKEAGVRNLERETATLCRKAAREFVEMLSRVKVDAVNLNKYLGIPKFSHDAPESNAIGVSTGLAWTEHGGEVLAIEVIKFTGKGNLKMTGKLGNVMQESAQAAMSYIKSKGISRINFAKNDFHVHVPEGAVPKDGPSAGIALATALASLVSKRPVKKGVAMTGEITLTGRVLPIGGLKEKVLAAFREKITTVIFPKGNEKDLEDIPQKVKKEMKLISVSHLDEVLKLALGK